MINISVLYVIVFAQLGSFITHFVSYAETRNFRCLSVVLSVLLGLLSSGRGTVQEEQGKEGTIMSSEGSMTSVPLPVLFLPKTVPLLLG